MFPIATVGEAHNGEVNVNTAALATGARQTAKLGLTGIERHLAPEDIIVSKTDLQGRITYVNKVFMEISGYTEEEMLGTPHSVIRHPDMPRAAFKLVWDTIASGSEIFAYVINRAKCGDHYWVLAHITPSYALDGTLIGYHSSRRAPRPEAVAAVIPLYQQLCEIEQQHGRKEGLERSFAAVLDLLAQKGCSYEQFILSL